jgi:uncharacterized membrane protein
MARILQRAFLLASAALLIITMLSTPALAHKEHKKQQEAARLANQQAPPGTATSKPATSETPNTSDRLNGMMDDMDDMDGMNIDRSELPFFERLYEWFGRLHPAIVHFPIAFFPAALFTAVVGRRRPAFSAPVQFLVVAGGILAPIAAAAGLIAGMSADPEPILTYHRWLGLAIGAAGAGLGIWAWRRPWEDRGAGMIVALTVMTIAIAVQGFLGAAITHGMNHLMF